eukprot:4754221-Pleurochrysis_carterae.AAC.1
MESFSGRAIAARALGAYSSQCSDSRSCFVKQRGRHEQWRGGEHGRARRLGRKRDGEGRGGAQSPAWRRPAER